MKKQKQRTLTTQLLEDAVRNHRPEASFRWKSMFGGAGYYVDEVIFAADYGDDRIALKLPEDEREKLLARGETSPNSKQYVTLPQADVEDSERLSEWVGKSLKHLFPS